jgi:hypothetical protein
MKILIDNGPHTVARKELQYRQRAIYNRTRTEAIERILQENDPILQERMNEDLEHQLSILKVTQARDRNILVREQDDEIRQTGIDPDEGPRIRRQAQQVERGRILRARWQEHLALAGGIVANVVQEEQPRGELENFARDNQNVHTRIAVRQTKDMIQKILTIPVPEEYRWNISECSKTPGDIIMSCKLTPKGTWQMTSKYCQDEDIYELGHGIYGKVLDGVWQYVLNSTDKDDLCAILKQEMEDNIGMCAQGNLTRLCNILAGYMEGIGVQESPAEILGRKLPLLMEVESVESRLNEAFKLLVDLGIPSEQWLSWVQPLVDSGTLSFKSSYDGELVGFTVI